MEHAINRILQFPTTNFSPEPSDEKISEFFFIIRLQQVDFSHGELYKYNLTCHWNFFFSTLLNIFSLRKRQGADSIMEPIREIGYAIAPNREINFGRILIRIIITHMGPPKKYDILENQVDCFFPRFLQLILNATLNVVEHEYFANAAQQPSEEMKINSISGLIKKNAFLDIPTVLTPYLRTVGLPLTLQVQVAADEPAGNVPSHEPHVDAIVDPIIKPSLTGLRGCKPKTSSQIQEPNTEYIPYVDTYFHPSSPLNSQLIQSEGRKCPKQHHIRRVTLHQQN